ncbi:nitrate ABC transporter permease [Actinomycetospora sp. NBRC 106375]|uniref:ABC transporter permease n=1 Tax=Actinomycetospora sp. NBRC 106375 TaxID=3032207 RepID=UPI0024A1673B|nr:ABC transporter permease subunit [Actinomycetospora sp. NBRC 106375]GLZ49017.1 nitrate ABC transporter permease [Actinomycetospora sp. NBRC 106375]
MGANPSPARRRRTTVAVRGAVGLLAFLAVGEVVGRSGLVAPELLPPSSVVLARLAEIVGDPAFRADVVATVLAWVISLGLALAIALPAGLLLGSVPGVRIATRALVEFLRPIPSVALIPLAVVLIGQGPGSKIALAVYAAVWPIMFNTIYAVADVDPVLRETAAAFRVGRGRFVARVLLPAVAPFVLTGVRLAAAIALILLVSTELLVGGARGIGEFITQAGSGGGRMDLVLAATVVAGLVGLGANALCTAVQRRWLSWSDVP